MFLISIHKNVRFWLKNKYAALIIEWKSFLSAEDPVKHDLVVSPFVLGFHPQVKIERGAWEYTLDFLDA